MQIILVNGKKRSGKDYFAEQLANYLDEIGKTSEVMSFAEPIKDIIAETFDITLEQLDDYKNAKQSVGIIHSKMDGHDYQKLTDFRLILQKFGTEAMKAWFGEDVWVQLLMQRVQNLDVDYVIVPDFRFLTEVLDDAITVKIKNDDVDNSKDQHRSETELDEFQFDWIIDNTGYVDLSKSIIEFTEKGLGL